MTNISINLDNNVLFISGYINFDNLEKVLHECIKKTSKFTYIKINLKNLYKPNSSVLIFMINYIRHTMRHKQVVKFMDIPELLSELSKVYNLKSIISR